MIESIQHVAPVTPLDAGAPQAVSSPAGLRFSDFLHSAVRQVEASAAEAGRLMNGFVSGESKDLHSIAVATQRASLEFDMFLQVRNKIVQAYQEVMRMQL